MSYFARIAILTGACMLPVLLLFGFILYKRIKQTKESNKIDRVIVEVGNLKSQLANTTQYLQQVAGYLQALDQRARQENGDDEGYKKS